MSEYNANDHLHNVTASVQRLTYQARGVQDITGANVADYEEISQEAAASVTLENARTGVPFLVLVNNLPPVQEGEGTPGLDNVRKCIPYTSSKIVNSDGESIYNVALPDDMYGGRVDYVARQIVLDIIRVQLPPDGEWVMISTPGGIFIQGNIPPYIASGDDRYAVGENCVVKFGGAATASPGDVILFNSPGYPGRIYYRPLESAEIVTVDDLKAWLAENPIYIYYRVPDPVTIPLDVSILYIPDSSYTLTAESGTLTVKYQGIAPDEP